MTLVDGISSVRSSQAPCGQVEAAFKLRGIPYKICSHRRQGERSKFLFPIHLLSAAHKPNLLSTVIVDRALAAMRTWELAHLRSSYNRIWVKIGAEVLPAVVAWNELGHLAAGSGVEIADATRLIFEVADGKLRLTQQMARGDTLLNAAIRRRMAAYHSGEAQEKPPTLFADIDVAQRRVYLFDRAGQPVFLALRRSKPISTFSVAKVLSISRQTLQVSISKRDVVNNQPSRPLEYPVPHLEIGAPAAENQRVTADSRPTPPLLSRLESQAIQDWLFRRGGLVIKEITRVVGVNYWVTLTCKQGNPYYLKKLADVYKKLGTNKTVRITLQEEKLDGCCCKTARLFQPGSETCLALFKLDPDEDDGTRIS